MIAPGTRIGNYEVVTLVGSGGMGEVYRAHDPRLGRDVAIKVLPAALSTDPERLRRFEQEARAAAALNHPNILVVHEVGTYAPADGAAAPYVVSELLEGGTLREALSGGPLPVRKAVDYARQLAEGLAAAHEKGVVHRDLKPENVFVTRDGRLKILDFGLAKLRERESAVGASATTLATGFGTDAGTVLGTAGYMSPEQVRAQPVDHRTDIFSFGAVLYEMLSGVRAFRGETAADTISAVLRSDPPELTALHATVPPALDRIVHHCLEKAPELRFQAARDIVFNLETLSSTTTTSIAAASAPLPSVRRRWMPFAAAAVATMAAIAAAGAWMVARNRADSAVFRQVTFRHGELAQARFMPDGQNIVYTAAWEGAPPEVFIVPAAETGGRSLDLKNALLLAVSPSGEIAVALNPTAVGFLRPGTLARGSMTGGAPKPEIENVTAADYSPTGALAVIRYLPAERRCVVEYPVGTVLYGGVYLSDLRFSPDGRQLAFIEHPNPTDDRGPVVVIRTDGSKVITGPLEDSHRGLVWSPSGDEVWSTAPLLDGVVRALDLRGRTRRLLTIPGKLALHDVAADGRMLLEEGTARRGMVVVSDNGAKARDLTWLDFSYIRAISDDGQMVLFEEESTPRLNTYVRSVDGSPAVQIGNGYGAAISADKAWALSMHLDPAAPQLWLNPIGPGQPRRISPEGFRANTQARFFRDGKRIVFTASEAGQRTRIYVQDLSGGAPRALTDQGFSLPLLSTDEKWIECLGPQGPVLVPIDGGPPVPIHGLQPGDNPRGWSTDNQLFVASATPQVLRIERLDPRSGKRTPFREEPALPIVGIKIAAPFITPDGRSFAYGYQLFSSDLYVVTGVR